MVDIIIIAVVVILCILIVVREIRLKKKAMKEGRCTTCPYAKGGGCGGGCGS